MTACDALAVLQQRDQTYRHSGSGELLSDALAAAEADITADATGVFSPTTVWVWPTSRALVHSEITPPLGFLLRFKCVDASV